MESEEQLKMEFANHNDEVNQHPIEDKENASHNASSPASSNRSLKHSNENAGPTLGQEESDDGSSDEMEDGSSESSSEEESDDDSVADPHLSEYERLRLRNIRRNEARLAQLGLLIPGTAAGSGDQPASQQSALTVSLAGKKRGRPKGYKNKRKTLEVTRVLPRRSAKINKRYDPSFERNKTPKSSRKVYGSNRASDVYGASAVGDGGDYYDESPPATPIEPSRIIKPQPHQKDFHDEKKSYLKQRRNRRGRPGRHEYVYVCEEKCCYCGGGWGMVLDVPVDAGENEACADQANAARTSVNEKEDEKKLVTIDVEMLDDEETKLIRCKGCREAFHPGCMLLNGGSEAEQVENEVEKGGDDLGTSEEMEGGTARPEAAKAECAMPVEDTSMEIDTDIDAKAVTLNASTSHDLVCAEGVSMSTSIAPMEISDEAKSEPFRSSADNNTPIVAATVSRDDEDTNAPNETTKEPCNMLTTDEASNHTKAETSETSDINGTEMEARADGAYKCSMPTSDEAKVATSETSNGKEIPVANAVSWVDGHTTSNTMQKEEPIDVTNESSEKSMNESSSQNTKMPQQTEEALQHGPIMSRPPCIPIRCRKCQSMRKSNSEQGDENNCGSKDDVTPPSTRRFKLEAVIGGKTLLCCVNPEPILEADLTGKAVLCRIMFGGSCEGKDGGSNTVEVVKKAAPVGKRRGRPPKSNETVTDKIEKIISMATDCIDDAAVQESSIIELQNYVDGHTSTTAVVRAGGLEVLTNAMSNHFMVPRIQAESIRTMAEITWYCQSLGMELVNQGCLKHTASAMEAHGTHAEIQQLGCDLFRALSYEAECCKAMFKADTIKVVMSSMRRNPNERDVLMEAACFIQNMIVVSFDTVDMLLESKRDECIISVLINAMKQSQDNIEFIGAACDVLSNVSLNKKGTSKIIRSGGGSVLHELLKCAEELHEVVQSAMTILYNLAFSSASLIGELVKADCASTIIAALKSSARDQALCASSFGLLALLSGADNFTKKKISNRQLISFVLDTMKHDTQLDLQLEAFYLLCAIEHTTDKQLSMNTAKRVLELMEIYGGEEEIQSNGCKILLQVLLALPEGRALKTLFRTGSGKKVLMSVPDSCKDLSTRLLQD